MNAVAAVVAPPVAIHTASGAGCCCAVLAIVGRCGSLAVVFILAYDNLGFEHSHILEIKTQEEGASGREMTQLL